MPYIFSLYFLAEISIFVFAETKQDEKQDEKQDKKQEK